MKFKDREVKELTETIVFKAKDSKRQQPVKISPCQDDTGKIFTGQGEDGYFDNISDEEKRKIGYLVLPTTVVTITEGKVLRPTNVSDKANWRWMQFHPYIAETLQSMSYLRDAVYYVEDKRSDARRRVGSSKPKVEAQYFILNKLSIQEQVRVAKAIGHPAPEGFSPDELQDYLCTQAEVPEVAMSILDAINPTKAEETNIRITFNDLVKWQIINKYVGGVYRFGGREGIAVGHNEQRVHMWLADTKNQETVAAMITQLDEKRKALKTEPIPGVILESSELSAINQF